MTKRNARRQPAEPTPVPYIRHYPKAASASPQSLNDLAGIFTLNGPVICTRFVGEDAGVERPAERAGD